MNAFEKTDERIVRIFNNSMQIMRRKNAERGDCWKYVGLLGTFVEIKSMYYRLKAIFWDKYKTNYDANYFEKNKEEIRNCLVDIRNFTIIAEMALDDLNIDGIADLEGENNE